MSASFRFKGDAHVPLLTMGDKPLFTLNCELDISADDEEALVLSQVAMDLVKNGAESRRRILPMAPPPAAAPTPTPPTIRAPEPTKALPETGERFSLLEVD